jgi:predicted Zn-dependent peptidase
MMTTDRKRPITKTIGSFEIPESHCFVLGSGHCIHQTQPSSIGVVRVELFWAAGSYHQHKPYVATLANDLLFSGNTTRSEYEVVEYLDYLGASYRTECGHLGSSVVVRASKRNIVEALDWVIKNIHEANYPKKELESAKLVRAASLERQQKTPKYWSSRLALESIYGKDHTLGIHGDPENYQAVAQKDLLKFKERFYSLNKLMILVSGDSDDALINKISDLFSPFVGTKIEITHDTFGGSPVSFENPILKRVEGTNQINLQLAQHVSPASQTEHFGLTLLNLVLGGYFGSRLMQTLREEKGFTYGVGSFFRPAFNEYTWTISGDLKSETIDEAISCIHDVFDDLQKNPLQEDELTKIKQYYSGQFRGGFDGPFAMSGKYLHLLYRGLGEDYYASVLPGIWSVTPQQLIQLANNYLNPNAFIHVQSGDVKIK